ncbi:MAG: nucleotidyltransferase domain-containing protein [Gemmatimonadetes bacterium]|nr:nucleotidyltransferase domain-containing protein [Gemmatimonadota bacterium]MDE3257631.1 nucleotidyltransferase domain-containing protein [Gemmatimonadota bacterium]
MTQVTDALLEEMVRTIVDEADPEQVILFGSHARGNATSDSDVDLLVIKSESFENNELKYNEGIRLYNALSHFNVPKDILVYSRERVEYWRDSLNHVVARALREGRVLYGRP